MRKRGHLALTPGTCLLSVVFAPCGAQAAALIRDFRPSGRHGAEIVRGEPEAAQRPKTILSIPGGPNG